ncbi:histone deacetylase 6 isoform X2 [Drosophila gunungcola]|uniref:histone deacetylase 6 isoform X2 n=1 Tax=Drosophila gunungcola TaxID=103775 RepID=UPI0022E90EB8|nr:histone deacetylase 6 isoform X2 [Drosophila gunungcola]
MFPQSPPIVTRRSAQQAKIQTRAMANKSKAGTTVTAAGVIGGSAITGTGSAISSGSGISSGTGDSRKANKPSASLLEAKRRARNMLKNQSNAMQESVTDIFQNAVNCKGLVRKPTALIYDESMIQHCCLWDKEHYECPKRFTRVLERCRELNLTERCMKLSSRSATKKEILRLHTEEHFELLKQTAGIRDDERMEELSSRYDSVYIHPSTFELSLLATGSTIELVDQLIAGRAQNGMAIIRPPGHHAMKAEFNGYCFFNNVALAAQHALDVYKLQRILIIDYDVHHGQGTQQFFYNDPRVIYFSIHRFEHGSFWPNLQESDFHAIGSGPGTGYNFNVPLNATGMTNGDYLAIFQQLLLPVALEFQPELIVVSAGYDAALGCPEGEMEVTPACYPHLLNPLLRLADCRVAVVLEGGYCLESLAEGAALTLRSLLGDPCPPLVEAVPRPRPDLAQALLSCIAVHRPHWRCLQLQKTYEPAELVLLGREKQKDLHQVLHHWVGGPPPTDRYPTRGTAIPLPADTEARNRARLQVLRTETKLSMPSVRVCYAYDAQMLLHCNLHDTGHPEQPSRIKHIHRMHDEYGLLPRMKQLAARAATTDEVCLAHTRAHVNSVRRLLERDPEELHQVAGGYNSVYLHPSTFDCATLAAGAVLQAVDSVLRGESRSGICNVRPPGHHAEQDQPHGFCIFNNVAIAAQYAIRDFGLERVLIVDWDVHHGNGTQHIFEANRKVLYISLHRYEHGSFFPKGPDGDYDVVGKGSGRGFNVNIPWNKKGMGDLEYALAFQQLIMPIAYEFNPQLVLVSAGFDAAIGDPLGGCKVTPEGYGMLTHWLSALAGGRIVVCLEGGYNVNSISYAMTMCTKTLLGDPMPTPQLGATAGQKPPTVAYQSCVESLQSCLRIQRKHWRSLEFVGRRLPRDPAVGENNNEDFLTASLRQLDIANDDAPGASGELADDQTACGGERPSGSKPKVKVKTLTEYMAEHKENEMYAVYPLKTCPHLRLLRPEEAPQSINSSDACSVCRTKVENWVCLSCQTVACGRFMNEHMALHSLEMQHPLAMSIGDLSVWCYGCSSYVDHPRLYAFLNPLHVAKFQEPMLWTYACAKRDDGCYPLGPDGREEDDDVAGGSSSSSGGGGGGGGGGGICLQLEHNN